MGIRIKKIIGYGLKDIITDDWRMGDDPRFNKEFWNGTEDNDDDAMERYYVTKFKDYEKWVKENYDLIIDIAENDLRRWQSREEEGSEKKVREAHIGEIEFPLSWMRAKIKEKGEKASDIWIRDFCNYDFEFGTNVIIFKPPSYKDWYRSDDIIDYCEANLNGDMEPYFKYLSPSGIYPHLGMVRFRDASSEVSEVLAEKKHLMPAEYSMLTGRWSKNMKAEANGENLKDLEDNWRCQLPLEMITAMAYIGEGFTDLKSFLNELRPMIYVYWS